MLEVEKKMSTGSDGLIARFLIAVPKPVYNELNQDPTPVESKFKLNHLIQAVAIVNESIAQEPNSDLTLNKKFLKFTKEAFSKVKDTFNKYNQISQKYDLDEPIIR